jgi:hypothetical protein
MSRIRLLVLLGLGVAIAGFIVLRPSPAAQGAEPAFDAEYGENTEQVAQQRWETNGARHWRYTLTRR